MSEKNQSPPEPTNLTITYCGLTILDIRRVVLKISLHCWERNKEFQNSKKEKVRKNLDQYLLDEKVIRDLVQQISEEYIWFEGVNSNWPSWKYYGCNELIDRRNNLNYLMIFFLDDNNPELIGVITVYPYE